jgi:hypothetical protein
VALSLRAERAADYFQLPGLDTHGQLLDNTPASDGDELQLARVGFGGGVARPSTLRKPRRSTARSRRRRST